MTFMAADAAILMALYMYMYLQSGQLARLLGRSSQVIRRRMRRELLKWEYVHPMQRSSTEEAAYCLGKLGWEYIAAQQGVDVKQLPFSRKASTVRPWWWRHMVLTNNIFIGFDLAQREQECPFDVLRIVPEWQLQSPRARFHHQRYLLSEQFEVEGGKIATHRPDGLMLLSPRGTARPPVAAAFIEADRATMSIQRIARTKFEGYLAYFRRKRYASAFDANGMRVLFVVGNVRGPLRIKLIIEQIKAFADRRISDVRERERFLRCFRFTLSETVTGSSAALYQEPRWYDPIQGPRLFLQPVKPKQAPAAPPNPAARFSAEHGSQLR